MEEITRIIAPVSQNSNRERDERSTIDSVSPSNDVPSTNNVGIIKDGTATPATAVAAPPPPPPQNSSVTNLPADVEASKPATQLNGRATTSFNQVPTNQTTVVAKKASKNVSFEDNDSNSSDRESLIEQSFYIRRGKHHYSASPTLEILSKKDRRRSSGIKANGFFGVEGTKSIIYFHVSHNQHTLTLKNSPN